MSVIDMIKSKIKEVFLIRKTAEVPRTPPVLCPRPTGDPQHPPHRHLPVFLKPLCPNFVWLSHWLSQCVSKSNFIENFLVKLYHCQ